jgi:hypothetical protein
MMHLCSAVGSPNRGYSIDGLGELKARYQKTFRASTETSSGYQAAWQPNLKVGPTRGQFNDACLVEPENDLARITGAVAL